jgi:hypothetical protein
MDKSSSLARTVCAHMHTVQYRTYREYFCWNYYRVYYIRMYLNIYNIWHADLYLMYE